MKRIALFGMVVGALLLGGAPVRATAGGPTITASDPASPANDRTPRLSGDPGDGVGSIEIYVSDKDCRNGYGWPAWFGQASEFANPGIEVSVPDDSTTLFYVRGITFPEWVPTPCSGPFVYVERSIPVIEASDPASPANENAPRLIGDPTGNHGIEIFGDPDECATGAGPRWVGLSDEFAGAGISVAVADDSTTMFYARGNRPDEGTTACSAAFGFKEKSTPTIVASDPPSPANDTTPRLKGTSWGNDLIEIYADIQQCRDGAGLAWRGTAAQFESEGIEVFAGADTTSTFYARGADSRRQRISGCSEPFTYEERSDVAPVPSARKDCFALTATILGTEDNDVIYGTPGPDVINGLGGNDVIHGLEGDDVICGGLGSDEIRGGPGADRIAGDYVASHERAGDDTIYGDGGDDSLFGDFIDAGPSSITGGDDIIYGGAGADFIKGDLIGYSVGADDLTGGNDTLYGEDGADFIMGDGIEGARGADIITGGFDRLYGGNGNDKLRGDELVGGPGADTIRGGGDLLNGGAGDDSLRGDDFDSALDDSPDRMFGGGDALYGESGNDRLEGDYIRGGPGNDVITGAMDALLGGSGNDVIVGDAIFGEAGTDIVHLSVDDVLMGGDGNDQMYGDGLDDREVASGGSDRMYGGPGDDYMNCEEGIDVADSGTGNDHVINCELQMASIAPL